MKNILHNNQNIFNNKETYIDHVHKYYEHIFSKYDKSFDYELYIQEQLKITAQINKTQFVKYIFKNNKLIVDNIYKYNESDDRFQYMYLLFSKTVEYCNRNNLHIPDTYIYVYITDNIPYRIKKEIPIFVMSTPYNLHYPLIPDNTFECFSFEKRWGKNCFDWNESKKIIIENTSKCTSNKIFFKGFNNSKDRCHCRQLFFEEQKKKYMKIKLLGNGEKYEPLYNFGKYKYLIDIPGQQEWSNRFYKLFLLNRVVFKYINTVKEFGDKQLISFIDLFLTPNVDYIEIKQELTTDREINRPIIKKDIKKIIKKVKKMNENTELYDKIASNGYNKINKLTNEHIYIYIYIGILYFSKHYKI
jgi:hypothetical protein